MSATAMIEIRNINTPGRVTRVNAEKYRAMRKALLAALPRRQPGLTQAEMVRAVLPLLPVELWPGGARARWWVKTVQLDLEAQGLVVRDRQAKPLRWYRSRRG
ncbi:MAG: hypothetical protein FJ191_13350 [Gammaproteobacteria bacterium]|nr:hypothetical protein [Gammaproteobacteria bacterium]